MLKSKVRELLKAQIEEFLANGGEITKVEPKADPTEKPKSVMGPRMRTGGLGNGGKSAWLMISTLLLVII